MTDYIVLDNMIWVQRLMGELSGSKVVDIIKKECDSVILNDEITDAYTRTLQIQRLPVPGYLSTLLITELEVMQKIVRSSGMGPNLDDVHRKDRYLVKAARPYRGLIITLDNNDLLSNRKRIEQNHRVRIMTPDEYEAAKRSKH